MKILIILLALSLPVNAAAQVGADKALHFAASFGVTAVAFAVTKDWKKAAAIGMAVGLAKELYDINKTGFDVEDLAADAVGVSAALMFTLEF